MRVELASIAPRAGSGPAQALLEEYLRRTQPYLPVESRVYRSEDAFWAALDKARARSAPFPVLLDSRGKQASSEQLAELIERQKTAATQLLVFAIGPADGWSEQARGRGHVLLSLGPMTLPHELARVVLAEQIYRAATILAGHPYHCGH